MSDLWTYPDEFGGLDVKGFDVEAADGKVGTVDDANYDAGTSYLVVDTGPLVFGKSRILPVGLVHGIDRDNETVYISWTKDQIKDAPEYDADRVGDPDHWARVTGYYREVQARAGSPQASETSAEHGRS